MLFLTYWFVLYASIFFPLYWIFPSHSIRRLLLVAGSVTSHTHFAGIMLHYTLYRMNMPIKPFIYQAF